ncbi:MAG: diguanylate cyclase [Pelomonas sp.]|nr:diguanylate cyclase [Roseateles sp.]
MSKRTAPSRAWVFGLEILIDCIGRWGALLLMVSSAGALALLAIGVGMGRGDPEVVIHAGLLSAGLAMLMALLFGHAWLVTFEFFKRGQETLERQQRHDPSTGMLTRVSMLGAISREWTLASRYGVRASLLVADVEGLRESADLGVSSEAADLVMQRIAGICRMQLRMGDLAARYGRKELAFLLPHTDPLGALDFAERLRQAVAALDREGGGAAQGLGLTIGVAALNGHQRTAQQWLDEAESARFTARSIGRHCVRMAPVIASTKARKAFRR